MFNIGAPEMVVIFLLALILFGPKKLPELGRTVAKAITEFRRASSDLKASFEREMHNLERETEALKEQPKAAAAAKELPGASEYEYYPYNDYGEGDTPHTAANNPSHNPETLSASEVPGAESHGTVSNGSVHSSAEPEHVSANGGSPAVEGTVPRTENAPQHS
jgi:sec-independent protein translocase protein TatA